MNDLEYLNSISASTIPPKPTAPLFNKTVKIIFGAFIGIIFIAIAALLLIPILTPEEVNPSADLSSVYFRASSLEKIVSSYNSKVSSASLRAAGTSLDAVLTDLSSRSSQTLTEKYHINPQKLSVSTSEQNSFETTTSKLETARLNGLLERSYASEVSYQISRLLIVEKSVLGKNPDTATQEYITSSYDSLSHLYDSFSNFSE